MLNKTSILCISFLLSACLCVAQKRQKKIPPIKTEKLKASPGPFSVQEKRKKKKTKAKTFKAENVSRGNVGNEKTFTQDGSTHPKKRKKKKKGFKVDKPDEDSKDAKPKNFGTTNTLKGSHTFMEQKDSFKASKRKQRKRREKNKAKKTRESKLFQKGVLPK